MKKIALIGSTGSIGRQVLNCVRRHADKFKIVSLSARSSAKLLYEQAWEFKPEVVALGDPSQAISIPSMPDGTVLYTGEKAMLHAITENADVVFVSVVGFCGLDAVVEAVKMDKTVALANKEALVAGGEVVTSLLKEHPKAKIIPVDSEHSAIWQSLGLNTDRPFKKIILTASGGAFRDKTPEELKYVKAEDALRHPNWLMGKKITVDCATMLNKGLEVIEAKWLFNAPLDKINVVVHPESIIHSMVEYEDSAVVCELAYPSMEIPIQLALSYPDRLKTDVPSYDFLSRPLTFKDVDHEKYPCFDLVLKSAVEGYNYPCALSSANEEAVKLFLEDKISYLDIKDYIEYALEKTGKCEVTLQSLKETDVLARSAVFNRYKGVKI